MFTNSMYDHRPQRGSSEPIFHEFAQGLSFRVTVDDATVGLGLTRTVFGSITAVSSATHEVGGAELEAWLHGRGGQLQVLAPTNAVGLSKR
ncbi:hypothetical protein ABZ438_25765 [Streptomyces sp. NPDC005786]|uniref:hypothetical protein n=1 Tax=Streptomyces sp. NPDC005786 TaxID=3154891 RepID=UPI0033CB42CA